MIAISYRREDSLPITGRLYDRLQARFGKREVFMDFDSIPPGVDFRAHIKQTIENSDVLLAVIGPAWLGEQVDGSRRIDDPADFVRLEVEYALQCDVPVIPLLVNTVMPKQGTLPREIDLLAFRNALPLDSGLDFNNHIERLVNSILQFGGPRRARNRGRRRAIVAILTVCLLLAAGWLVITATRRSNEPSIKPEAATVARKPIANATATPEAATSSSIASPPSAQPDKAKSIRAAENDYAMAMDIVTGLNGKQVDETEAARLVSRAAKEQVPEAEARLAYWSHIGFADLKKDDARATNLANQALKDGITTRAENSPAAQEVLGLLYEAGLVPGKGPADAIPIFQKAADSGDTQAQVDLGQCYQKGTGVIKNSAKAVELYRKAADSGNAIAQNYLGLCYENGDGVKKDLRRAIELLQQSADRGYWVAKQNLMLLSQGGRDSEFEKVLSQYRQNMEQSDWKDYQTKAASITQKYLWRATQDCASGPHSDSQIRIILIVSRSGEARKALSPPGEPFTECIARKINPRTLPRFPAPPQDSWPVLLESHFQSWNFKSR